MALTPEIATPGFKSVSRLTKELEHLKLPGLTGKTVLDIGAWDGFFSFEAERRGAKTVVALDHHVWSIDWARCRAYYADCAARQVVPDHVELVPELWKPHDLIGKRGFDLARELLGSSVEPRVADFMTMDLASLGAFDVVLFLGVLYHLKHPFEAMTRLAQLTREVAIIETEAIFVPGLENMGFFEFLEANELNNDVSNWWVPNMKALVGLCRAAGFRRVESVHAVALGERVKARVAHWVAGRKGRSPVRYRAIVHAWK